MGNARILSLSYVSKLIDVFGFEYVGGKPLWIFYSTMGAIFYLHFLFTKHNRFFNFFAKVGSLLETSRHAIFNSN